MYCRITGHRQFEAGHGDHHLQAGQGVAGVVGVNRGQRPFVAGVHRLQHVERLAAADFAHDDAVGPHAEAVANQVALGDPPVPSVLGSRVSSLTTCGWLEDQFRRVFDRDQPLAPE
jgi:hypothetical protein